MDKVYYYNHKGQLVLTINEAPYFMQNGTGEFKNSLWEYDNQFGRYRNFRRGKTAYPFSIVIASQNLADYDALCNIFDADVIAGEPGKFVINGWELECLVVKAEHVFYGTRDYVVNYEALATNPMWTRSTSRFFNGIGSGSTTGEDFGRNYSYNDNILGRGYDYGYDEPVAHSATISLTGSDNGYEAIIYGPATNPTIYINNEPITVNVTIASNERLRIVSNGSTRTIDILQSDGSAESAFVYRDKEHSPFVSLGKVNELTYGSIKFDFTTIERRSEPSWT